MLVAVIAAFNLIGPILQLVSDFSLLSILTLILAGLLSLGLWNGVCWVRLLFVTASGLAAFYMLFLLLGEVLEFTGGAFWLILLMVLRLVYSAASCLLLLFSKSVKEFLYK